MADFKGFFVEEPPAPLAELGARKVTVWTDDPLGPNEDIRLWVGAQEVDALSVDALGLVVEGFVVNVPDPADTLHYQFSGSDKTDSELTAETEPGNA